MGQKLLAGLVGLDHLVAKALNGSARLSAHLSIFDQQNRHPRHRAPPIIKGFASVWVGAANLQEPRAVELLARLKVVERALVLWLNFHVQSFVAMIRST